MSLSFAIKEKHPLNFPQKLYCYKKNSSSSLDEKTPKQESIKITHRLSFRQRWVNFLFTIVTKDKGKRERKEEGKQKFWRLKGCYGIVYLSLIPFKEHH